MAPQKTLAFPNCNRYLHRNMEFTPEFGARVAEARQRAGISQETLGHRVGLTRPQVWLIERGRIDPRFSMVAKIAAVLKVTVAQLAGEA